MSYRHVVVAQVNDLQNGEMKIVQVDDHRILLSKVDGQFHATGASCPHYGAPLDQGVLHEHRVTCPWHHAAFDVRDGTLQEPPALEGLERFDVHIDGDDVVVKILEQPKTTRVPTMVREKPREDDRTFVIIGAGAAGNAAALALREQEFRGRLVMITYEDHLPYDRPNLSKMYLSGKAKKDWLPLRSEEFYRIHDIEIMRNTRVERLDINKKTIHTASGESLKYNKVLIATGGVPKTLDVPGADLDNIFTLRTYDDADALIDAVQSVKHVTIIGSGFIGTEAAASLRDRDLAVEIISLEKAPFEKNFGLDVGKLFQTLHEEKGVTFHLEHSIQQFNGNGTVDSVELDNGETIDTDVVLLALGVTPATQFIEGLDKADDGSLVVDEHFQVAPDVFAAGDIVRFPDWRSEEGIRIEHFRTAEQHGRIAASNMMDHTTRFSSTPFFWTTQVGLHFRYVGHATDWDQVVVDGDIPSQKFLAFYVKHNKVYAVAGVKRDQEMAAIQELLREDKMPSVDQIRNNVDWLAELKRA